MRHNILLKNNIVPKKGKGYFKNLYDKIYLVIELEDFNNQRSLPQNDRDEITRIIQSVTYLGSDIVYSNVKAEAFKRAVESKNEFEIRSLLFLDLDMDFLGPDVVIEMNLTKII